MIQANELRLGNWVKWNNDNFKIYGIDFLIDVDLNGEGFIVDLVDNTEKIVQTPWMQDLEPIPLTPEILEKCGLEENAYDGCFYIYSDDNHVHFEFDIETKEVWVGGHNSSSTMDNIKSLHQLQNLYFALTGEELKIEL